MAIRNRKEVRYNGKFYFNMKEFCQAFDINYQVFSTSMRVGKSVDEFMKEYYAKKGELAPHLKSNAITVDVQEVEPKPITSSSTTTITVPAVVKTNFVGGKPKKKFPEIITSPSDLLKRLGELNFTKVNLIDFENLVDEPECLTSELNDENTVNVFFYNAVKYSNQFYELERNSKSQNFQVLTRNVERQLVDHIIMYYTGALSSMSTHKYNIVSRDRGYYMFVYELDMDNVDIVGYDNYFIDKKKRLEISLARYISIELPKDIKTITMYDEHELRHLFRRFEGRGSKNFHEILAALIEFEFVIKVDETNSSSEYYMINKSKAAGVCHKNKR